MKFLFPLILTICFLTSTAFATKKKSCAKAVDANQPIDLLTLRKNLNHGYLAEHKLGLGFATAIAKSKGLSALPPQDREVLLVLISPDHKGKNLGEVHQLATLYGIKWFHTLDPRSFAEEIAAVSAEVGVSWSLDQVNKLTQLIERQVIRERGNIVDADKILRDFSSVSFEQLKVVGDVIANNGGLNLTIEFLGDLYSEVTTIRWMDSLDNPQWGTTTSAFGRIATLRSRQDYVDLLKVGQVALTR